MTRQTRAELDDQWKEKRDELATDYISGMPLVDLAAKHGYSSVAAVNTALWRLRNRYHYDLPYRREDLGTS